MNYRMNPVSKDSLLCAALISATLLATAGSAVAEVGTDRAPLEVQSLDPVVVTARRGADVKLETIVVTAPRLQRAA
jgi:hypothetical protein